ncbi:phosphotransferase [Streptomyces sp. NPDC018693]|uniref:phosphotransferase n=1 Tax=unclassified Streptomyces TaxID=2593676 RepID=UPI0037B42B6A
MTPEWRLGLFRGGPLGRRVGLRTTGGRDAAAAARIIDRPSRRIGRCAALLDQIAVRMRVGPRVADPLADVEPFLHRFLRDADGAAFVNSSMPGRCVIALSTAGKPSYVLKIGNTDDHQLRNEGEFLTKVSGMRLPFKVPELVYADSQGEHCVVVTRAWMQARRAGPLSRSELLGITEVLGAAGTGVRPLVHGDLAPWNVLRTPGGIGVIDWETATFADQPLRDLVHYLVQAGAIMRWTDVSTVVRELTHPRGMVGELAGRLGVPRSRVPEALHTYFATSPPVHVRRVRRFRESVAAAVGVDALWQP